MTLHGPSTMRSGCPRPSYFCSRKLPPLQRTSAVWASAGIESARTNQNSVTAIDPTMGPDHHIGRVEAALPFRRMGWPVEEHGCSCLPPLERFHRSLAVAVSVCSPPKMAYLPWQCNDVLQNVLGMLVRQMPTSTSAQ